MAAITKASKAKPLEGALTQRVQLGATVTAPAPVTLQSDGKWDGTDTSTAQLTVAIVMQSGVDGDWVDAVTYGPVVALSGATVGTLVYASDTAGAFDTAAGTKTTILGHVDARQIATAGTVLFVNSDIVDLA